MIDLHCHLLPGVDDGAQSMAQAVSGLERMADQGIQEICLTPHLDASRITEGPPPRHDEVFAELKALAPPNIKLHRGAEVMLDRALTARTVAARRVTLGGTRYILVEFTRMAAPTAVNAAIRQVISAGLVPLVAHPERYASCAASDVARWREAGALMQVDATTVFHATTRGQRARLLIALGLADVLAADNHGDDRSLAEPFHRLAEAGGEAAAILLMLKNPAAILADQSLEPVPPLDVKLPFWSRVRGWISELNQ